MPHIRILRHYFHTPHVVTSVIEGLLIFVAAYFGYFTRFQHFPEFKEHLPLALTLTIFGVVSMSAMGVYGSRVREGYIGMMLRSAVALFLLATSAIAVVSYFLPSLEIGRGVLLFSTIEAFVLIAAWRWLTAAVISDDALKRRVLVLGTGTHALAIAQRMRRRSDRRGFVLLGYMKADEHQSDLVSEFGAHIFPNNCSLLDFCIANEVDEIVIATKERRRNADAGGGLPIDDLLDCRLSGIEICEVQAFIERESGKLEVDLIDPSWIIYSDGFVASTTRLVTKRSFDVFASVLLLLCVWPVMLATAGLIGIGGLFREPILYKQERIGLNGKHFEVMKFRSMRTDAELDGQARWATENDPRITRIGAIIRKSRIDELPQLFNVLRGDMSFVGPRPERPQFVEELNSKIPYYDQRHRVKPGITGWAQLCYPYGASVNDSKEKLKYDLYYLKNHSFMLDLIILFQTVEVVLVGDGAR